MKREYGSLSMTVKQDEFLVIGDVLITIVEKKGRGYKVRINAPKDMTIRRESAKRNEAKDEGASKAQGLPSEGMVHEAAAEDKAGRPGYSFVRQWNINSLGTEDRNGTTI